MRFRLVNVCAVTLLCGVIGATEVKSAEDLDYTILRLHDSGEFEKAEPLLKQSVNDFPDCHRISFQYGLNLFEQQKFGEAADEFERTVVLGPDTEDAQRALVYTAEIEYRVGRPSAALELLSDFRSNHPDSRWLPQAKLLELRIRQIDSEEAKRQALLQENGVKDHEKILAAKNDAGTTLTLLALKRLVSETKGLPIELTAREAIAHILTTTSDTQAAIHEFQGLINELEPNAPNSRIVQTAFDRIAALHHRTGNREDALAYYNKSINAAGPGQSQLTDTGILKSAGLVFEMVQHDLTADKAVDSNRWIELRNLLDSAKNDTRSLHVKVIAELMELESYVWSKEYGKAIEAGTQFLDSYSTMTDKFSREIGTAYVCLSRITKELGYFHDSIHYAQTVLDLYKLKPFIWPQMDHIPRAYFDLIESLYSTNQHGRATVKLNDFAERFPESPYLKVISRQVNKNAYSNRIVKARGTNR